MAALDRDHSIADALAGSRPSVPIDRTFEELLTHEVMTSERRRMLSLAGLLSMRIVQGCMNC